MDKLTYLLGFAPNPRFDKRIQRTKNEFDVSLVCWIKDKNIALNYHHDELRNYFFYIEADPFNPVNRIRPFFEFKEQAIDALRKENPSVIHVQNTDMLYIAVDYKKKHNSSVHIAYEVADLHRMLVDKQKGLVKRTFATGVKLVESYCSKSVDCLIVTSERYYEDFYRRYYPKDKVLFIPNAPYRETFANYVPKNHSQDFTIGFIGGIRYIDEIKLLIDAAEKARVKVFLAGFEKGNEIRDISSSKNYVEYFGKYDYASQISYLYQQCDAIHSVYPANMKNVQVALPNKLYESIICGLPLIVASNTYVGELVNEWGVGLTVPYDNQPALVEALELLRTNKDLYERLSDNCISMREKVSVDIYLDRYVDMLIRMMT